MTTSKEARSSKKLGTTRLYNFYLLNPKKPTALLIDTPGYGFQKGGAIYARRNTKMLLEYVKFGTKIKLLLFLLNAQIGWKASDLAMMEKINKYKRPVQIVAMKSDKILDIQNYYEMMLKISAFKSQFDCCNSAIHICSNKYD